MSPVGGAMHRLLTPSIHFLDATLRPKIRFAPDSPLEQRDSNCRSLSISPAKRKCRRGEKGSLESVVHLAGGPRVRIRLPPAKSLRTFGP